MNSTQIILASGSPRRRQILQQIGVSLICMPVDIDESFKRDASPNNYCRRLAMEKAQAGWDRSEKKLPVLGSDTIVVLDDKILGKPRDKDDAFSMLMELSNKTHQVITAVALITKHEKKVVESISHVVFEQLNETDVRNYIATKQPMDKAGSYGIQGHASVWIKHISGSYSGIMGLPIYETAKLLRELT